ncbi:MAG TPA: hypothetical protein PLI08_02040 [Bacteroidia bacterium]|jgi:hypothetical protein|nr:hypothetical protein [Bacteroidia bacterium]HRI40166.1 hypothetical protein [Bacteroidia bacterium]HRU60325.1 hypothetical protein [Bacteroidia bacterium]
MRKVLAVFFAILFLTLNSGVVFGAHWCKGEFSHLTVVGELAKHCKCGKKSMDSNCCKDEIFQLKANEELSSVASHLFELSPVILFVASAVPSAFSEQVSSDGLTFNPDFSPPGPFKEPRHILLSVFLI